MQRKDQQDMMCDHTQAQQMQYLPPLVDEEVEKKQHWFEMQQKQIDPRG